jgi:menaquinone-dependent protoporphyrinogen oxidase
MRILVVHGSKRHGTEGIAQIVAETLRDAGFTADLIGAAEAGDVSGYDAVIVGGGLYAGHWHRDARRFVQRQAAALKQRPVWLFSSGPLDRSAVDGHIPPTPQVRRLLDRVGARGHVTFGGFLAPDARGLLAGAMAKRHAGDWRDAGQIRNWARGIADSLIAAAAPAPGV